MATFGRFGKPRTHHVPMAHHNDGIISEKVVATPQSHKVPVLRNFSYPTNVGGNTQIPSYPPVPRVKRTTWDQLGEICNFSPDDVGKARTAVADEPFFFRRDQELFVKLTDQDLVSSASSRSNHVPDRKSPNKHKSQPKKKPRRSALLSLSSLHIQNKPATPRDDEIYGPKDKSHKVSKSLLFGDHILPQRTFVSDGFKRNSLGQRKGVFRSNAYPRALLQHEIRERPASSSGVPIVDTRFKHSSSTSKTDLPLAGHRRSNTQSSFKNGVGQLLHSKSSSRYQFPKLDSLRCKSAIKGRFRFSMPSTTSGSEEKRLETANAVGDNGKGGKSNWLSQLKAWVSVSEPSNQAFNRHKKDTYKEAGIALDDPRAHAKLHLPVSRLPPEAIKHSGPGPDPEEVAMKKSQQRKKLRQPYNGSLRTSHGSRSSSSQHSSSSSFTTSSTREDTGRWS